MSEVPDSSLFVSWIHFHGRSEGLARALGIREWASSGGVGAAWRRYIRLWGETARLIEEVKPRSVIVMQPPIIALACVLWNCRRRRTRVAGDLHTGVFDDPKWTWATRLTLRLLRRRRLAIVTNQELAEIVTARGGAALVMHDLIEEYEDTSMQAFDDSRLEFLRGKRFVLVPVAYSYDEPLQALRDAAVLAGDVTWVFTGRAPEEFMSAAPSNMFFTGFASRDDFMRLLSSANVVIAATTSENTMQRAGYEALCMARPLLTTDTRVLREYFGTAALQVRPDGVAFSEAVGTILEENELYAGRMVRLRAEKLSEQRVILGQLRDWLDGKAIA